jgi:hypothetical protein
MTVGDRPDDVESLLSRRLVERSTGGVGMDGFEESGIYLAGYAAPAGRYRRVDGCVERVVVLEASGVLPASRDGRVAIYVQMPAAVPAPTRSSLARQRPSRPRSTP